MRRPPGIVVVAPGIGAGLDRDEAVAALGVGDARGPAPVKFGSSGAGCWSRDVDVAAGGVGLPDLDQRVRHRPAVLVEHAAGDDDALAERLAGMLAGQVGVARPHALVAVDRAGQLRQRVRQDDQRLLRRALLASSRSRREGRADGPQGSRADIVAWSSSDPLQRHRHALADADAHRRERRSGRRGAAARAATVGGDARARHAERMAERDGAAVRVDVLGVVGNAELAQAGERLAGEGLVELDHVEVADLQPEPLASASSRRRHRADAHDARRHAGASPCRGCARAACRPCCSDRLGRGEDHRRRAVVDAGGVAGRHRAVRRARSASAWRAPRASCRRADARPRSTVIGPALPPGHLDRRRSASAKHAVAPAPAPRAAASAARRRPGRRGSPGIPRRRSRRSPAWNRRRTAPSSAG